ncbi:MAG: carboxypeptidase-like regulatory domain-containing protein, partial [Bacteroidota bacterium]
MTNLIDLKTLGAYKDYSQRYLRLPQIGLLVVYLVLSTYSLSAQDLLPVQGRVIDAESGEPLPFATVYFNNSTYGTNTDEAGEFRFVALPGKYDLIVNFFSYKPIILSVELTKEAPKKYLFKMSPLEYDLPEISIESSRDEVWYQNFKTFQEQFLGRSSAAQSCKILNPEVVVIDFNHQTKVMSVSARDILQ